MLLTKEQKENFEYIKNDILRRYANAQKKAVGANSGAFEYQQIVRAMEPLAHSVEDLDLSDVGAVATFEQHFNKTYKDLHDPFKFLRARHIDTDDVFGKMSFLYQNFTDFMKDFNRVRSEKTLENEEVQQSQQKRSARLEISDKGQEINAFKQGTKKVQEMDARQEEKSRNEIDRSAIAREATRRQKLLMGRK